MAEKELNADVLSKLNNLLDEVDLDNVTADSSGYSELPDGYALGEVESADLTVSKSKGEPMVAIVFKAIKFKTEYTESGEVKFADTPKYANRKLFMYWVLKDAASVERMASDMLKFEKEEGKSLLEKEFFTTSQTLIEALELLGGMRGWIRLHTTPSKKDDGEPIQWKSLVSWSAARKLGIDEL